MKQSGKSEYWGYLGILRNYSSIFFFLGLIMELLCFLKDYLLGIQTETVTDESQDVWDLLQNNPEGRI